VDRCVRVKHLGKPLDHLGFGNGIGRKGKLRDAGHVSVPTIGSYAMLRNKTGSKTAEEIY
jgi:hypothetical protein